MRRASSSGVVALSIVLGIASVVRSHGDPPSAPAPHVATRADFEAIIKDLAPDASLVTLQLGPGAEDNIHVLVERRQTKQGDAKHVLYWASTTKGALGDVARVKDNKSKMEPERGRVIEVRRFDLPPVTVRAGDTALTHELTLLYHPGPPDPTAYIFDSLSVQRGVLRSGLNMSAHARFPKTGPNLINLWGVPRLYPSPTQMSNPPECQPYLFIGPNAAILPGQGTVGPLTVTVTTLGAKPEVTEKEALVCRTVRDSFAAMRVTLPAFVMKKAIPSTDYQLDFSCDMGPVLGVASNVYRVKTESIINKPRVK
jgi:hypothetical protein